MARVEKIVVDASVAVKWYNIEDHTENALKLRADYAARRVDLVAPYLLVYEIANSLRYNPDFGAEDLKSAMTDIFGMQMGLQLLGEELVEKASNLAFKYGITFYDASYLALAEAGDAPFYSADDKLLTKVANENARHIRDYRSSK